MATERNPYEQIPEQQASIDLNVGGDGGMDDDVSYEVEDDGVLVSFSDKDNESENPSVDYTNNSGFYRNLVEELDEDTLDDISRQVLETYEADVESRSEWEEMFTNGLDLLGLKLEQTDEPFEGACTAVHPLLIESAVSFQSKAISEIFPAGGPVKTQILGTKDDEKQLQADRVREYMNYQLTEQMPEYYDETERMLFHLPLFGSSFKKMYYDAGEDRPVNEFVPIDQFVVSNYAPNLKSADRYTQVLYRSPIQLEREIISGMYVASDDLLDSPSRPELSGLREKMNQVVGVSPTSDDYDGQYTLLEQHCYLEIESLKDDSNLTLPYIVTVDKDSGAVLSIRRNYDPNDPKRRKKLFFTHYRFVPALGFYGIGYIHMLGNLTATATAAMRSLLDAGQFATLPAGFKAKGVRTVGENDPISPGEFREVEATGMDLSKSIIPLPYKEPSQTLFAMLQFVSGAGQKFADSTEQVISDNASYGPVGTTMALLEASSKFFSAVHKRLHQAQRDEFKILARINKETIGQGGYPYAVYGGDSRIARSDFDDRVDVIPVSDPNVPSSAHRMMMAQMALQLSQQAPPGMYNIEELHKTILRAANIPNLERIIPEKVQPQPLDPVSDIMAATKGMPIKAFPGQDHNAHMQVKMAYLQDPKNGGNPIMQRVVPILSSNIQEHSVMLYQEQMNGVTKQLAQSQGVNDPKVIEQVMAQAAQQVMNANKVMGTQNSPEQQMVMMEAERLRQKDREIDLNATKTAVEAALEDRALDLKEKQMQLDAITKGSKELMNIDQKDKDRQSKQVIEAVKILTDLAKHDSDLSQREQENMLKYLETITNTTRNNDFNLDD